VFVRRIVNGSLSLVYPARSKETLHLSSFSSPYVDPTLSLSLACRSRSKQTLSLWLVRLRKGYSYFGVLLMDLSLVCPARSKETLLYFFSIPYFEPQSDKDMGESLRELLLGDFLGK
jgi:hypothetical protein